MLPPGFQALLQAAGGQLRQLDEPAQQSLGDLAVALAMLGQHLPGARQLVLVDLWRGGFQQSAERHRQRRLADPLLQVGFQRFNAQALVAVMVGVLDDLAFFQAQPMLGDHSRVEVVDQQLAVLFADADPGVLF